MLKTELNNLEIVRGAQGIKDESFAMEFIFLYTAGVIVDGGEGGNSW